MKVFKLGQDEERAFGFTHRVQILASDLAAFTTAGNAGTITLLTIKSGEIVSDVAARLVTPFSAPADAANNSTALQVGKTGTLNQLLASTELNQNGSNIAVATRPTTVPAGFTADTPVLATITPAAGKALSAQTVGEVNLFLAIRTLDRLV